MPDEAPWRCEQLPGLLLRALRTISRYTYLPGGVPTRSTCTPGAASPSDRRACKRQIKRRLGRPPDRTGLEPPLPPACHVASSRQSSVPTFSLYGVAGMKTQYGRGGERKSRLSLVPRRSWNICTPAHRTLRVGAQFGREPLLRSARPDHTREPPHRR